MKNGSFVDTNILIYAAAGGLEYPGKWEVSQNLFSEKKLCLSGQVLAEFYHNCRKKRLIPADELAKWLTYFATLECVPIDTKIVLNGAAISQRYKISYWDAALIAAAKRLHLDTLYSEDLNHGQSYDGVRVINPFLEH